MIVEEVVESDYLTMEPRRGRRRSIKVGKVRCRPFREVPGFKHYRGPFPLPLLILLPCSVSLPGKVGSRCDGGSRRLLKGRSHIIRKLSSERCQFHVHSILWCR